QPADVAWLDLEGGSLPEIPDPHGVEPEGPDSLFGPIDPGEQVGRDSNAERHTRGETGQRRLAGHVQAEMMQREPERLPSPLPLPTTGCEPPAVQPPSTPVARRVGRPRWPLPARPSPALRPRSF